MSGERVWSGAEPLDDPEMTARQKAWDAYSDQREVYPWPNWVLRIMQEGDRYAVRRDAMWRREVQEVAGAGRAMFVVGILVGIIASFAGWLAR